MILKMVNKLIGSAKDGQLSQKFAKTFLRGRFRISESMTDRRSQSGGLFYYLDGVSKLGFR